MLPEPGPNFGLLMSRIVGHDQMQLLTWIRPIDLTQNREKLLPTMPWLDHARDLSRGGLKSCEQCRCYMPVIIVSSLLRITHTHRQQRCRAIQSLKLGLFIDIQHGRILRRCKVQADNIGYLRLRLGIGRELERLRLPRLDPVFTLRPGHGRIPDVQMLAQQARRPVRDSVFLRWRHQRGGDDIEGIESFGSA